MSNCIYQRETFDYQGTTELQIKLNLDLENFLGGKVDDFFDSGLSGDILQHSFHLFPRGRSEREPDVVIGLPFIIVGYTREPVGDSDKSFDLIFRNSGRTQGADPSEAPRIDDRTNPAYDAILL